MIAASIFLLKLSALHVVSASSNAVLVSRLKSPDGRCLIATC